MTALRCQVEVSATSRSLVQSSPTECFVSVCHHKASMTRRPRPLRMSSNGTEGGISIISYLHVACN